MRTWIVDDVMTTEVVTAGPSASYRELVDLLAGHRVSAVPVTDEGHHVIGVVSETDLLRKIEYGGDEDPRLFEGRRRRGGRARALADTADGLMSSPPVVVMLGTPIATVARMMDAEEVKRLPVVDDADRLAGIVTRGDLLRVHLRPDSEIGADVRSEVFQALLAGRLEAVSIDVQKGVVTVAGHADRWSTTDLVERMTRQVPGVVRVVDELDFDYDDRQILVPARLYGEA
ncbi:CBS domain-containing protein [Actinoplanes sp. LDG1-06]|uniref:CBS domain-containing protein n=1 Tax=Paractinoplanes ovalisporus TaxID=2810368 RepID=A0ABS2A914_9ACTN|nr:CBS domain-containing protein [Actinoplanes ovalisporus]MBM2616318.1 CBS domain-containing protein [Actinoplanes ovalisporus]